MTRRLLRSVRTACAVAIAAALPAAVAAQPSAHRPGTGWGGDPPPLAPLVALARSQSDLRVAVERYVQDKAAIERRYEVPFSPVRHARLRTFYEGWRQS